MWPFAGLLEGIPDTLLLTNTSVNDSVFAETNPEFALAEARLATDGDKDTRVNGISWQTPNANQWMSDEFAAVPAFDASNYECGYFNVTGDTNDLSGPTLDTYHALSSNREWTLSDNIGPGFDIRSVTGEWRVREIANPSNEATATLTLSISSEL